MDSILGGVPLWGPSDRSRAASRPEDACSSCPFPAVYKNIGPVTVNAVTGPIRRWGGENHSAALG